MRNYIHADIKRILRKTSHTMSMLLLFAIFAMVLILPNRGTQVTSVSLIATACNTTTYMLLFIGLFEMIGVFTEDLRVKTMQAAIGLGISRTKVVLCKLLEVLILVTVDMIVLLLITLGAGRLLGTAIPFAVLKDLLINLAVHGVLATLIYTALTTIVLFTVQSPVLSIFVYVLCALDVVGMVIQLMPLFGFDWIEHLHLTRFTLSHLLNTLEARMALGTFSVFSLLGALIYLGVGITATCKLFAKRELDF